MAVYRKGPISDPAALANEVIMQADDENPPCLSQTLHNDPKGLRGIA